jgi:hypothetical protein
VFSIALSNSAAAASSVAGLLPLSGQRFALGGAQRFNPVQEKNWDSVLALHPDKSFFHGSAWAKVLQNTYGFSPVYFAFVKGNAVQSLLPMMEVDSRLTGKRGVALPFTDDCEPLIDSESDSAAGLIRMATEYGHARGWNYMQFKGARRLFRDARASISFYRHDLSLAGDEDLMFGCLGGSVRRAIRKAIKSGVKVEISCTMEAVQVFHAMQCETRRKHGLPPQSFEFFRNLHEQVLSKNLGMVALAMHRGRPIAGAVHFKSGHQAVYKYGASFREFRHLRGNNLVMWEAIKWHSRQGARALDMGRASLANTGLRRFKLSWGAVEKRIDYFKYDLNADEFIAETDESLGWHNRLFQIMPLFLSRAIGAVLYRHWA